MPETLMDQARRALHEERHEDAQAILVNVIAREPEHEEAWLLLAEAMADAHKKRECLERARVINPRNRAILRALEHYDSHDDGAPEPTSAAPGAGDRQVDAPPPNHGDSAPAAASAPPAPVPAGIVDPWLEQGQAAARRLMLSVDPSVTRELGRALLVYLDEAAARDPARTRRWSRSAGREALLKYEKALTAVIAALPRGDPQLVAHRQERHRALSHLR